MSFFSFLLTRFFFRSARLGWNVTARAGGWGQREAPNRGCPEVAGRCPQRPVAGVSTGGPARCWPPLAEGRHWVAPTIGAASHCGLRRVRPRQCGALDGATAIDLVIYIVHFLHPRSLPPSQRCLKPAPNLQLYKCLSLYFLLLPYPSISIHIHPCKWDLSKHTWNHPIPNRNGLWNWWSKNNTFMTYLMFYDCYDLCFRPSHLWCMMLEIAR